MIRTANEEDAERIVRIHLNSWRSTYNNIFPKEVFDKQESEYNTRVENIKKAIRNGTSNYVLLEEEKIVKAFICYGDARGTKYKDYKEIYSIYIESNNQKKGYGTKLIKYCFNMFKKAGYKRVIIRCLKENTEKMFDDIKHIDEFGNEYWLARELQSILQYTEWRRFKGVIDKAKIACESSGYKALDHFVGADKMVEIGSDTKRKVSDYKLSRYACYLIAQNGDSRKKVIALAQTYFAIQTRKMELTEREYSSLTEEEKRFYQRNLTKKGNYSLNIAARNAGVKNFDKFHNARYKGLYNGETADDIAKRKKLRYREDILDNMGSEELIANLFRISQTEQKLKRENINSESEANKTHYEVGSKIRNTIKELGGTMPEDLPTPDKSLKELEKENKKLKINDYKYNIK